ncbi:NucA/NucB deoxyribonuclease domain-containing protein [Streptomyces sp. NPDC005017]|uniref:NucA/NucB deoxyribonuclease domain-containing protein n=1 Tax=Streptomyces sp. NPDC005017 TaxID=3364706 RepID=UPI0036C3EEFB
MAHLLEISQSIRTIQDRGGYGVPGYHNRALHRTTTDTNRAAVCGRRIVGPPPSPGLWCDEYPFATTREGGRSLNEAYRGWAWVPRREQIDQGTLMSTFYRENRVIDGDSFWVSV